MVEVRSARGRVPFRARVTDNIVRGAVECMFGGGTPVGPRAWQEWNVNELTDLNNFDAISGFPVYKALLCDVARIGEGEAVDIPADRPEAACQVDIDVLTVASDRPVRRIYLDNNATTRMADEVGEAMRPYLESDYGNPSSIHDMGREAEEAIEKARRQVARLIGARPRSLIFTGGGSEAVNLALKGVAFACTDRGKHIVTTSIEHPAVISTGRFLEKLGYRVTWLDVDEDGWLEPDQLEKALTDDTILVSIAMANNEVGTILPIRELCEVAHRRGVLFHTDAVQAVGKIKVDVTELGVDLLSLSGHKFHGPKGVGALYVKQGVKLESVVHGGKQEVGLRAGTENVPAIVGLGKAAELAMQSREPSAEMEQLRDGLEAEIRRLVPGARLNGHRTKRLPNTLNLTLPGLRGESIVLAMNRHGVLLSSGSACKSGSPEPTHVLIAMGRSEEEAHCSVRFSLSHYITERDIKDTAVALARVLEEKSMVRMMPCR